MKRLVFRCLIIQVTVLFLICCLSSSIFAVEADLIIHNGKIVTVDSESSICRAMAVKDNRILHLGGNGEILQLKGDDTKVVDLKDKMVMPGMEAIKPSADGKMGYGDMAVRYVFKRLE